MSLHYLEVVTRDVDGQCSVFERAHGLSFGPAVAELGQARVAEAPSGHLVGVRAPLAVSFDREPSEAELERFPDIERPFNVVNMDFVLARAD